jgi:hypothetical protein
LAGEFAFCELCAQGRATVLARRSVIKPFVQGHPGFPLKITDRRLQFIDRENDFADEGVLFEDFADDFFGNPFKQWGGLMHSILDDAEEEDIVHDAVQALEGFAGFIVEDVQVDFEGVACRQFFLEDAMAARENEIMQLNGDHG